MLVKIDDFSISDLDCTDKEDIIKLFEQYEKHYRRIRLELTDDYYPRLVLKGEIIDH